MLLLLCLGANKCCSKKAFVDVSNGSAVSAAQCQGPGHHRCCSKRRCGLRDVSEAEQSQQTFACEAVQCCSNGQCSPGARSQLADPSSVRASSPEMRSRALRVGGLARGRKRAKRAKRLLPSASAPLSTPDEARDAERVLRAVAVEGLPGRPAVTLTHTTGNNLAFAANWVSHVRRAAVRNHALIATDAEAWDGLARIAAGHAVRCPSGVLTLPPAPKKARDGASFQSGWWVQLVFAVPRMLRSMLETPAQ